MENNNIPNILTLFRIVSVPFVIFLLLVGAHLAALALFLLASLTDFVDGYIARKRDQISPFGKFADPIADKLLVAGILITFIQLDAIAAVPVVIIIARGFIVTGIRLLGTTEERVISASWLGKVKTVSHITLIVALTLNLEFNLGWLEATILPLVYFAVGAALVSGIDYLYRNKKLIKDSFQN
ncbi:MAG: CDP-diacylglycerol--glycerol-3-phosphate 3-phosphatidyltransferase [Candidatus Acetothermia bacterium]